MNSTVLPHFMIPAEPYELGSHKFTEGDITAFARKYDTQPFHLDRAAASNSLLGGLCASGWHTAAVWMRKMRERAERDRIARKHEGLPRFEFGPSPGFENLRWYRPVYVDDTIFYTSQTLACRPSASKPGWHILNARQAGRNQRDEPVISFETAVFLRYPV